ncbi:MAG: hypothetical protein AMJ53_15235 [Gammaproteobacteria bacterium SG8_11]|nr:MAG: hypothetical protein AMJ53_15235 [Gammaproteobacteria bacterium SG8_11]
MTTKQPPMVSPALTLLVLALAILADGITTLAGVMYLEARELNPLVGIIGGWPVSLLFMALVVALLYLRIRHGISRRSFRIVLIGAALIRTAAAFWNTINLLVT